MQIILNILPSIIAFLGITISYINIKKSYKMDLKKIKKQKNYEKIENLPFLIMKLLHDISDNYSKKNTKQNQKNIKQFSELMYNILSYGSNDAIKIACYILQSSYVGSVSYMTLAAYSVLISQLKYDLSGEILIPNNYFKIRLTDFNDKKYEINKCINKVVSELNLNKKFKIKDIEENKNEKKYI